MKICKGYSDFGHRIRLYIENITYYCNKNNISYEILIGEDIDEKNELLLSNILSNIFLQTNNTRIIQTHQSTYSNPLNYNMLEAPNKNACMYESKGKFLCFTSGDILMNSYFFDFIHDIRENCFYRFLTYAVNVYKENISTIKLHDALYHCENNIERCYNLDAFKSFKTVWDIAYKSGDIMLMDRNNWIKIQGFPENGYFHHTDSIVCSVVMNNDNISIYKVNLPVKIYSVHHDREHVNKNEEHQKNDTNFNNDAIYAINFVREKFKICNPDLKKYFAEKTSGPLNT